MDDITQIFLNANKQHWNEVVSVHAKSPFYDIEHFKSGNITLMPIERAEVGDVNGKELLHLQCHLGLDTLSWARLGASVTGVDFSSKAIAFAESLCREQKLETHANFIEADVYDLTTTLHRDFDIVFTSYGVLNWLPELSSWARVIASFVRVGGFFYIAEIHPFSWIFDEDTDTLKVKYSYFGDKTPLLWDRDGTYAEKNVHLENRTTYLWQHTLGDLVTSLIAAGLRIDFLHEFKECVYEIFPSVSKQEDGMWSMKGDSPIPLLFSLKATRIT